MDTVRHKKLLNLLAAVLDYLKHGYRMHLDRNRDIAYGTRRALIGDCAEKDGGGRKGTGGRGGRGGEQQPRRQHGPGEESSKIYERPEGGSGIYSDGGEVVDAQKDDEDDEAFTDGGSVKQSNGAECLKPFQVVENVWRHVNVDDDEVGTVLTDCANKLKLFTAHQIRF